ncbi:hypothetical protein [Photobacterium carnosum]|uniref:hypothetical protein n=1 Tax=Photobacterium carnosum TaxID=2023717 RepID=UPI001E609779|nr:hypothetical protein [Photobacterium carnosum]MCD9517100.1 hypothetical protein [Photobacterium carnosum]
MAKAEVYQGDNLNGAEIKTWKSGDSCVHDCISGTLIIDKDGWYFKPHGMIRVFQVSEDRIRRPHFEFDRANQE